MIRHFIFIIAISVSFNALANNEKLRDELKEKEFAHKCDIINSLEKRAIKDEALKAKREAELTNLKQELTDAGMLKDCE